MEYKPKILSGGELRSDDQILAAHEKRNRGQKGDAIPSGEGSSLVIMEMLQRLRVKDAMRKKDDVFVVSRTDSMTFAQNLMKRNHISGLPVVEGGRLFGVVSMNDIILALESGSMRDPCQQHMATNLVVLEEDMPIAFAVKYFQNYTFGRFPVLNKDRDFVGIVTQRDVMRVLMKEMTDEIVRREEAGNCGKIGGGGAGDGDTAVPYYSMRQFVVVRNALAMAGRAANEIKKMMKDAGMDKKLIRRVAVAAYELEINICIHSLGGTITFIMAEEELSIIAKDRGPGIEDVEWACQDGTSTANDWIRSMGFGAGMGLANSKRVSDEFEISSKVPTGTVVMCRWNLKKHQAT